MLLYITLILFSGVCSIQSQINDEAQAWTWMADFDKNASLVYSKGAYARWDYQTNITDETSAKSAEASLESSQFNQQAYLQAKEYGWKNFKNETLRRLFSKVTNIGPAALPAEKAKRLGEVLNHMRTTYSTANVCNGTECEELEPGLTKIMAESRDYDRLLWAWEGWRKESGNKMRDNYTEFVQLSNEGSKLNGFEDNGAYWRSWYEDDALIDKTAKLWNELKPLYQELHAYTLYKLKQTYKDHADKFPNTGHIPAHLLGNMWAQSWVNLNDILKPFPEKQGVDVTDEMVRQGYNATAIFRLSEEFFTSLGLEAMVPTFWNMSMLEKPSDRKVVCHASAWDFMNGKDFRVKQCTVTTMTSMITAHHEMGHVQYFQQYAHQPIKFRTGANPGFHEAIGDVLALSVATPGHLKKIKLLPEDTPDDDEMDLNFLMSEATKKLAFLPFGYLIDQWRWDVFRGNIDESNYNQKWWDLRCKIQGLTPPVKRTEDDFDPGAKYHVPANTPYIRYFVSHVLQFQFHKAMCKAAGHTGPLYKCDIYQSKNAGNLMKQMMELGASKHWADAMEQITGGREMTAAPLVEYFRPLLAWLRRENKKNKVRVGWFEGCEADPTLDEAAGEKFVDEHDRNISTVRFTSISARWNYQTNITDHNQKIANEESLKSSQFSLDSYNKARRYDWQSFQNETLKRLFGKITSIGPAALADEDKKKNLTVSQSEMTTIYSTAKVCRNVTNPVDGTINEECLNLNPGIAGIMANSRDYDELLWAWKGWRDSTGPHMKDKYEEFVKLSNEGSAANGFVDTGDYWRSNYETENFKEVCAELWETVKPLYQQLHAYARRKLSDKYGRDKFPPSGHIPAHLLGHIQAQVWTSIYPDILRPYMDKPSVDVTPEIVRQGWDAKRMFTTSEEFFTSLGMIEMPEEFWNHSMIERPKDGRQVVCHASAWDFYNRKDFRIKQCTRMTMGDLVTTHHEMGHVQYYLQYKHQPVLFRRGGNPGFHEAIGDVMSLSVNTPSHLHQIGLLERFETDKESDINFLMRQAASKLAFLPTGYFYDLWRWSVFSGETKPEQYNKKWWDLTCKYAGICSPVERTENDFDPGAKYHIPANTPYIRYFISYVIQFQFHKSLCDASGHKGPLHACDIYKSKEAGKKLSDMMQMGSSRPWPEAMEALTGSPNMSADAMVEYFKPLLDWLQKENEGFPIGWEEDCPMRNEADAQSWMEENDAATSVVFNDAAINSWNYDSNMTDETRQKSIEAKLRRDRFKLDSYNNITSLYWAGFQNETLKRLLGKVSSIGPAALRNSTKSRRMQDVQAEMSNIYAKGKVCDNQAGGECYGLEPGLTNIMRDSRDYDRLKWAWQGWRNETGKKMRSLYTEFAQLSNEGTRSNGFMDTGDYWRSWYEDKNFQAVCENLWNQLKPFYEELHAYTRHKLMEQYGAQHFPKEGHIPAHLLGNMWAQSWMGIYKDILIPYKGKTSIDVTDEMVKQKYTARRMFDVSEDFFSSIGLLNMTKMFWEKSIIEHPNDGRTLICHASAWDFMDGKDFRIKQCTDITMTDLITVHHEMGHTEYQMLYRHQPVLFRTGANPGFHEAIGDVLELSVSTPKHLKLIGLLQNITEDRESDINFLMGQALKKIAFLPFGYLIDQWRWKMFDGTITPEEYNKQWWKLRCKYQGVSPPVSRSETDFDPGAKYHIPGNTPYIRYFVSHVLQFHFHKSLCEAAGHSGPLYKCDIYKSKEAGAKLRAMLELGGSKPWPDALEQITGSREMTVEPIIEYFQPLIDWLKRENKDRGVVWRDSCPDDIPGTDPSPPTASPIKDKTAEVNRFRTSTIVLGVLFGVLAVALLGLVAFMFIKRNKSAGDDGYVMT